MKRSLPFGPALLLCALGPLLLMAWVLMAWVEVRPARTRTPPLAPSLAVGALIAALGLGLALAGPALLGGVTLASPGMTLPALANPGPTLRAVGQPPTL